MWNNVYDYRQNMEIVSIRLSYKQPGEFAIEELYILFEILDKQNERTYKIFCEKSVVVVLENPNWKIARDELANGVEFPNQKKRKKKNNDLGMYT